MASKNDKSKPNVSRQAPWARLAVAILPGYVAAIIVSSGITALLPLSRGEATALSLLLSGLIYTGLFIYVFAVKSWRVALRDIAAATFVFGLIMLVARGAYQ